MHLNFEEALYMTKTKPQNQSRNCPSCGAPIVSEICAYCGTATGLNTAKADMEYPVLECKAVVLNFWTTWFPSIFAFAFGTPALILLLCTFIVRDITMLLIALPFLLLSVGFGSFIAFTFLRYKKVKSRGKTIQGVVYGYVDDNVMYNNKPGQMVKILVQTPNGPRFILYRLGGTVKIYGINDTLNIKVYKNLFLIPKNKEVINW